MADIGDGSVTASLTTARLHDQTGMSWFELVTEMAADAGVHGLTSEDIDWLLWEHTAWPIAGYDYVCRQLVELFADWKGMPHE